MKVVTTIARILVGLLFIFSGFIKSNDPKGTGYKLSEYFDVFAQSFTAQQDSIRIEVANEEFEIFDRYTYALNQGDEKLKVEMNQSPAQNMYFEGDEDSTFGSMVYIVKDQEVLYSYFFYEMEDAEVPTRLTVSLVQDTTVKVLNEKTALFNNNTKFELPIDIGLAAYVKKDSFLVGFFKSLKPFSLTFSIIMCILEIVLGFAILIGWKPKIMSWAILLLILFFTFLTWYSAYYNKVTDCGCFGDFLKLEPWTSFYKDVVLTALILIIFFRRKHIIPLFSPLFNINAMIIVVLASTTFSVYCNMYLPAFDFLPYKAGNNIRELMTPPEGALLIDETENILIYQKDGQMDSFVFPEMPKDQSWKFVKRIDKVIRPAWKSVIHDFNFNSPDDPYNLNDTLLRSNRLQILIVSKKIEPENKKAWEKIKQLCIDAEKEGIGFHAVTATPLETAAQLEQEMGLPFHFRNGDETLLKTIVRSNPGVILWHNGTILDKWSFRSIPGIKKVLKFRKRMK